MKTNWLSYNGKSLISPGNVKGYNKLSEVNKQLFTSFLTNFYKVWEYPEDHQPIKVEFIGKENFLKATFAKEWFHVTNANNWY